MKPGEAALEVGVVPPEETDTSVEAVKVAEVPVATVPGSPLDSVVLRVPAVELGIPVVLGAIVATEVVVLAVTAVVFGAKPMRSQYASSPMY